MKQNKIQSRNDYRNSRTSCFGSGLNPIFILPGRTVFATLCMNVLVNVVLGDFHDGDILLQLPNLSRRKGDRRGCLMNSLLLNGGRLIREVEEGLFGEGRNKEDLRYYLSLLSRAKMLLSNRVTRKPFISGVLIFHTRHWARSPPTSFPGSSLFSHVT